MEDADASKHTNDDDDGEDEEAALMDCLAYTWGEWQAKVSLAKSGAAAADAAMETKKGFLRIGNGNVWDSHGIPSGYGQLATSQYWWH